LEEKEYPYLYLDATYLKVRWGARVTTMALLAAVGVDEEGFREVLAVEVAGSEKGAAYIHLTTAGPHRPWPLGSASGSQRRIS
jgi:putative transposase